MNRFKRIFASLLCLSMLASMLPINVLAADDDPNCIKNAYISYSINPETGGFSVVTTGGHPQKAADDKIPLLFQDVINPGVETSFTTIKIGDDEYIFGRDYSHYGIETKLSEPVVTDDNRQIQVVWTVGDYEVTQHAAISLEENESKSGNIAIRYTVKNNGTSTEKVGIRVLFDTSLGKEVDAPLFTYDSYRTPVLQEKEFSDTNTDPSSRIPKQLRGANSNGNATLLSYFIFEDEIFNEEIKPDKVIIGHWANMANTRYDYAVSGFESYAQAGGNSQRTADNAVALYWEEPALAGGETLQGDILYGVGNIIEQEGTAIFGLNASVQDAIEIDPSNKKQYKDDGEITLVLEIDNTFGKGLGGESAEDVSVVLHDLEAKIVMEEGFDTASSEIMQAEDEMVPKLDAEGKVETDEDGKELEEPSGRKILTIIIPEVNKGDVWRKEIKLTTEEAEMITAKQIAIQTSSLSLGARGNANAIINVLFPGVGMEKPKVSIDSIEPEIVYYQNNKNISVIGDMKELKAIWGREGWDLYMVHTEGTAEYRIKKSAISFEDEDMTVMNIVASGEMVVGDYRLEFRFTDDELSGDFGDTITSKDTVGVSDDEKYALRKFGVMAIVRDKSGTNQYKLLEFPTSAHFDNYVDGYVADLNEDKVPLPKGTYPKYKDCKGTEVTASEILFFVTGDFQAEKDETEEGSGVFAETGVYTANPSDGDIIINGILEYTGNDKISISKIGANFVIEGDGEVNVINSVSVWADVPWKITIKNGLVYSMEMTEVAKNFDQGIRFVTCDYMHHIMSQTIAGYSYQLDTAVLTKTIGEDYRLDTDKVAEYTGKPIYGVSFGGKIGLPLSLVPEPEEKPTNESGTQTAGKSKEPKKKTPPVGSMMAKDLMVADVTEVRFGQGYSNPEDLGFVGVDADFDLSLGKGVFDQLGSSGYGMTAKFGINTFLHEYNFYTKVDLVERFMLDFTLNFKGVEANMGPCKGELIVIPNDIKFGYKNNTFDPALASTGVELLGASGGVENLSAYFDSNLVDEIPNTNYALGLNLRILAGLNLDITGAFGSTYLNLEGIVTDSIFSAVLPTGTKEIFDETGKVIDKVVGVDTLMGIQYVDVNKNGVYDKGDTIKQTTDDDGEKKNVEATGIITGTVGLSVNWKDDVLLKIYGSVDVLKGVIDGQFEFFINCNEILIYVRASVSLGFPAEIPVLGEIGRWKAEVAGCNDFIGANLNVLGFDCGIKYEWVTGKVGWSVLDKENLDPPENMQIPEIEKKSMVRSLGTTYQQENNGEPMYVSYGTNFVPLDAAPMAMSAVPMAMSVHSNSSLEIKNVSDNILFTLPLTYEQEGKPEASDFTITKPDGTNLTICPMDLTTGEGNFLIQEMPDGSKVIYFSVPEANNFHKGVWTVSTTNTAVELGELSAQGVLDIAGLDTVSASYNPTDAFKVNVNYAFDSETYKGDSMDFFLTTDPQTVEKINTFGSTAVDENGNRVVDLGVNIGNVLLDNAITNGSSTLTLPQGLPDGTYYLVANYVSNAGGAEYQQVGTAIEFTNPNLPKGQVEKASLTYAGNGNLYLNIHDNNIIAGDYTDYRVALFGQEEDGSWTDLSAIASWELGIDEMDYTTDYVADGEGKQYCLKPSETLPTGINYKAAIIPTRIVRDKGEFVASIMANSTYLTEPLNMPEMDQPKLLSVKTNIDKGLEGEVPINVNTLVATYTFDRPVYFEYMLNGIEVVDDNYHAVHTIQYPLTEGVVQTSFKAYEVNGDSCTNKDFYDVKNASLAFVVDTVPPVLSLRAKETVDIGLDSYDPELTLAESLFYADTNGEYTIEGLTDCTATVTINGETPDTYDIDSTGNFILTSSIKGGYGKETIEITATDRAGNKSIQVVTVVREDYSDIESIALYADGEAIGTNAKGEQYLEIYYDDEVEIEVYAVTSGGEEFRLSEDEFTWYTLYESNTLDYDGQYHKGEMIGETALVFAKPTAMVEKSDAITMHQIESYVIVNVLATPEGLLQAALDEADLLIAVPYETTTASEEERKAFEDVVKEAQELMDNIEAASDAEINAMTEKLNKAINQYKIQATREYVVSADPSRITFPSRAMGYGEQEAVTITIKNISEEAIEGMDISLISGVSQFTLDTEGALEDLPLNGETTISLKPKTKLSGGTYKAKIAIEVYGKDTMFLYSSFKVRDHYFGDVNEDGVIDVSDNDRLFQFILGKTTDITLEVGDINGDGMVDIADNVRLFDHITGKEELPHIKPDDVSAVDKTPADESVAEIQE